MNLYTYSLPSFYVIAENMRTCIHFQKVPVLEVRCALRYTYTNNTQQAVKHTGVPLQIEISLITNCTHFQACAVCIY
jgi:hypothetical protein